MQARLEDLIVLAQERWGQRISYAQISRAARIDYTSILCMLRQPQRVSIGVVRGLCWYFQCQPGALIELPEVDKPLVFHRAAPPDATEHVTGEIVSRIAQQLAALRTSFLVTHLQCSRVTVVNLRQQPFSRIETALLMQVCHILDAPSIDTLLQYHPQLQQHTVNNPTRHIYVIQASTI